MASQPPEHIQIQNDTSGLKTNEYQTPSEPKLQNGQPPSEPGGGGKGMKSPPSNGAPPPPEIPSGYHQQESGMGIPPPTGSQPQPGMHHQQSPHMIPHGPGGEKEDMQMQGAHHHHQQHPMYSQPMHPMHAPPSHMPGHHMPMHPHQQRYPHHAPGPHGPMQHPPMHPHDPNQQQQMDPYAHYRGGMMGGPRPPQRYGMPPQGPMPNSTQPPAGAQQGPTPTLNSLLQSQPSPNQPNPQSGPPPPHRYYDPYAPQNAGPGPQNAGTSSPMPQSQQQQQQQGAWAPPRPYSPQQYRGPPPVSIKKFISFQTSKKCFLFIH